MNFIEASPRLEAIHLLMRNLRQSHEQIALRADLPQSVQGLLLCCCTHIRFVLRVRCSHGVENKFF
jgi:hypothetical protein